MTPPEFDQAMSIMRGEYKQAFTPAKLSLIWDFVSDLSYFELNRINAHFLASIKGAPLPINYREAAQKERASKPQQSSAEAEPYKPKCLKCLDVGVVGLEKGDFGTFALCDCKEGDWQVWRLPRFSETQGYTSLPLPWELFKPDIPFRRDPKTQRQAEAVDIALMRAVEKKVAWWKEQIRRAEKFWDLPDDGAA